MFEKCGCFIRDTEPGVTDNQGNLGCFQPGVNASPQSSSSVSLGRRSALRDKNVFTHGAAWERAEHRPRKYMITALLFATDRDRLPSDFLILREKMINPRALRLFCRVQRAPSVKQGNADTLISPSSFGTGGNGTHRLVKMKMDHVGREMKGGGLGAFEWGQGRVC